MGDIQMDIDIINPYIIGNFNGRLGHASVADRQSTVTAGIDSVCPEMLYVTDRQNFGLTDTG